ncbi:MAG: GGDEF domain-containing response regulator [Gemmatimonadota bacterium]|nr:GGDEF domain-containing response regulator [Gemmatimonadota bacterium]
MSQESLRIVLVESDPATAAIVRDALASGAPRGALDPACDLHIADSLAAALQQVGLGKVGMLVIGMPVHATHPADVLARMRRSGGDVPSLILVDDADEEIGVQAVTAGAQDYLLKSEMNGSAIRRAIRYAAERHRMFSALHKLSLSDELTGLLNRRGFFVHADRAMRLAPRTKGLWLLLLGLDGLKTINEEYGQREGDKALEVTAKMLRETCRDSDIIARVGGDEFATLLVDSQREAVDIIMGRLKEKLRELNGRADARYSLSLSMGTARKEPKSALSLDQLLTKADDELFERKQHAKSA